MVVRMHGKRLALYQFESKVSKIREAVGNGAPHKGWIRAIRDALGMTGGQLAERLGVSQPRVVCLEQDELRGSVTMKTMREAAEAMDCMFVYAIVPRTTVEDVIRKQAEYVALQRFDRSSHTMMLEDQELQADEKKRMYEQLVDDLVRDLPRDFWQNRRPALPPFKKD